MLTPINFKEIDIGFQTDQQKFNANRGYPNIKNEGAQTINVTVASGETDIEEGMVCVVTAAGGVQTVIVKASTAIVAGANTTLDVSTDPADSEIKINNFNWQTGGVLAGDKLVIVPPAGYVIPPQVFTVVDATATTTLSIDNTGNVFTSATGLTY